MEYRSGVDQTSAIAVLRSLHWIQHSFMALTVLSVLWYTAHGDKCDWPLAAGTVFAPALLRGSCGYDRRRDTPLMSPRGMCRWLVGPSVARLLTDIGYSHALEAGLPVATLLATLVMCWYSPLGTMPPQLDPARAVPMLIVCPTTLGVMIAFIQRGFRR